MFCTESFKFVLSLDRQARRPFARQSKSNANLKLISPVFSSYRKCIYGYIFTMRIKHAGYLKIIYETVAFDKLYKLYELATLN